MIDLCLIRIDRTSSDAFNALASTLHTDEADCDKLTAPENATAVQAFIAAHATLQLKPIKKSKAERKALSIFSVDPSITELPSFVDNLSPDYQNYIQKLRRIILATVDQTNGTLDILMDPLKAGERIAIFFRPYPDAPWSIANAVSIKKIDYIRQLLNLVSIDGRPAHTGTDGVPAQLGIYEFSDKTRILTRYYIMEYPDGSKGLEMTTMYEHVTDATPRRVHVPEDSFIQTGFQPVSEWEAEHEAQHGTFKHHYVTESNVGECEAFIPEGEVHFTVYKSGDTITNKSNRIHGRYWQIDSHGDIIIQDDHRSALEDIMADLAREQDLKPTIFPVQAASYTPSVETWEKRGLAFVEKIETVKQGVKIGFKNKGYLLDEGDKLTLHGDAQNAYLEAMVLHARECWGNQFRIECGSEDVRAKLISYANIHGVTLIPADAPARPSPRSDTPSHTSGLMK